MVDGGEFDDGRLSRWVWSRDEVVFRSWRGRAGGDLRVRFWRFWGCSGWRAWSLWSFWRFSGCFCVFGGVVLGGFVRLRNQQSKAFGAGEEGGGADLVVENFG